MLLTVGRQAAYMFVSAKRQYSVAETKLLKRREILSIYGLYGKVTVKDAVDFATEIWKQHLLDILHGAMKNFGESSLQSWMTDNYP